MIQVLFDGIAIACNNKHSLLDNAIQQKIPMPYSCMAGVCHACLVQAVEGNIPKNAQLGLSETLKKRGAFLACQCYPTENMVVQSLDNNPTFTAKIVEKSWLNADVTRLQLETPDGFDYKAGQFINIFKPDTNTTRSYSLASFSGDNNLELHIKIIPNGQFSHWICNELVVGNSLSFKGATGECYYQPKSPKQDLILGGVGTGLAPLYSILRKALSSGHKGKIHLFHASLDESGLYYQDELRLLAQKNSNLTYIPCVLHGETPEGGKKGSVDQIISEMLGRCRNKQAYLCGDDAVVQAIRKSLFMAGMGEKDIFADAFTPSA